MSKKNNPETRRNQQEFDKRRERDAELKRLKKKEKLRKRRANAELVELKAEQSDSRMDVANSGKQGFDIDINRADNKEAMNTDPRHENAKDKIGPRLLGVQKTIAKRGRLNDYTGTGSNKALKMRPKGVKLRKNVVVQGIKIKDAKSKKAAINALKVAREMKMSIDDE